MNFRRSFLWLRWKVVDWDRNGWASCATALARKALVNPFRLNAEAILNQQEYHRYSLSKLQ